MNTTDRPALIQRLRWFADNTGDGELFVQAADMLEADDLTANVAQAVPTGKQSLQVAKHRTTGWMAPVDRYAVPVLFNPYTGEPRDARDVASDPHGILIVPPGKVEMLAARQYPADMPNGDAQLKNGGLSLQPAVPQEPVAYCVYFPTEQRQEFCQELDDLCDDLTNLEHEITPLYAAPQPQRPRLTDEVIDSVPFNGFTDLRQRFESENECLRAFARAIERKVRGER